MLAAGWWRLCTKTACGAQSPLGLVAIERRAASKCKSAPRSLIVFLLAAIPGVLGPVDPHSRPRRPPPSTTGLRRTAAQQKHAAPGSAHRLAAWSHRHLAHRSGFVPVAAVARVVLLMLIHSFIHLLRTPSAPTHPSPTARRNHKQRAHEARAKAHKTPAGRGHTILTACNGCHAAPPATKT